METKKEIYVTETILPQWEAFAKYTLQIFSSKWLTNNGALVRKLEKELTNYLGTPFLSLYTNGTMALQLAIRLFGLNGKKIITTPYTYVATLSALLWENCSPIFIDVNPYTACLDPHLVNEYLKKNPDVAGIMPVQVYGNACDIEAFNEISSQYDIPVIYDGAHAFGSIYKNKSLLSYGQASMCSFHATKLFHTVEGGCLIVHNREEEESLHLLRAFGHRGDNHYTLGINAKLSELHAAMGLALLPMMPEILKNRAQLTDLYDTILHPSDNSRLRGIKLQDGLIWNHAYYPLIFSTPELRAKVMAALEKERIHPRRYFYPVLTRLPYIHGQTCPIAEEISEKVLCLPLWADMPPELVEKIAGIILGALDF